MIVGIQERGTSATKRITGVIGFKIQNGFLMLDLLDRQRTFYADELVCCAPSEPFNRDKMKPFLKPGQEHKEMCDDVEL